MCVGGSPPGRLFRLASSFRRSTHPIHAVSMLCCAFRGLLASQQFGAVHSRFRAPRRVASPCFAISILCLSPQCPGGSTLSIATTPLSSTSQRRVDPRLCWSMPISAYASHRLRRSVVIAVFSSPRFSVSPRIMSDLIRLIAILSPSHLCLRLPRHFRFGRFCSHLCPFGSVRSNAYPLRLVAIQCRCSPALLRALPQLV